MFKRIKRRRPQPPRDRPANWDDPLEKKTIDLGGVEIAYIDEGGGAPILFVHGIPTSGYLWRNVIRGLKDAHRCIAPDLMGLGDTETPLGHRYDMGAQADKLIELANALGLEKFALVCHDQGGAAAQWLAVHHPKRIDRFVLTNCVCYDNWPVPIVKAFSRAFQFPPLAMIAPRVDLGTRWGVSPIGMRLGVYDPNLLSNKAIEEFMKVGRMGPGKFEQFRRFTIAGDPRWSIEAAKKFGRFNRPTYIAWAAEDRWLSVSWARQLFEDIAGARALEIIPFAGHFLQEEKPERLAELIREWMAEQQ